MKAKPKIKILSNEEIRKLKIASNSEVDSGGGVNGYYEFEFECPPDGKTIVSCSGVGFRPHSGANGIINGIICIQKDGSEVTSPLCEEYNAGSGSGSGSGSSSGSGTNSGFASTPDEACIGKPEGQMCFWTENGSTKIGKCVKKNDYGSKTTCKPY